LVAAQRDPNDVDVEPLNGPAQGAAPPAAYVEQRHAGLQIQLAKREVELGELRLLERHVFALEVRARVAHGRTQEQREEIVGDVVDRLRLLVERLQAGHAFRHAVDNSFSSSTVVHAGGFVRLAPPTPG
jgi:hypothetical protein